MEIPTVRTDGIPDPLPEGLAVLDVREPDEWVNGHIEGATHVPLGEVQQRFAEVPSDTQVLVVCKAGGRSAQAAAYLLQNGVDAVNFDGGMGAWAAAGRPMVSENGETPKVV